MTESSFPIVGKDYTNGQFGAIGASVASGVLDQGGSPYALTLSDTANTATIGVSTKDSKARAVVSGFGHLMDAPVALSVPAVTATTVYHVGLRYDPTKAAAAGGPVALAVITGVVQLPDDGSRFVEFYRITRSASTVLSASAVVVVKPAVMPAFSVENKAALLALDTSAILLGTTVLDRDTQSNYLLQSGGWLGLGGSVKNLFLQTPQGQSGANNDAVLHFLHTSDPFTLDTAEQADISFECIAGGTTNWAATFVVYVNDVELVRRQFRNNGGGTGYLPIAVRKKATLRAGSNTLTVSLLVNSSSSGRLTTNDPQFRIYAA